MIAAGDHSSALLIRLRRTEMELAARRAPMAVSEGFGVNALREALVSKGGALKTVLVRMVRMVVHDKAAHGKPTCTVSLGAGGQSASETVIALLSFELAV